MERNLPDTFQEFTGWTWPEIEPYVKELGRRGLTADSLAAWLSDWSHLLSLVDETSSRLRTAAAVNTRNEAAHTEYRRFREKIWTPVMASNQDLRAKLLGAGLDAPEGLELPVLRMKADARVFCEKNLPLLNEEKELQSEYDRIVGAQTVMWEGEEVTVNKIADMLGEPDRATREKAWRLRAERQLADRDAIGEVWRRLVRLRHQMAVNAGYEDYRALTWDRMYRFDYNPEDCYRFHDAVEVIATPAVGRIYERYGKQLGVDRLRPWDLDADPSGRPPLRPFVDVTELEQKASRIFHQVDSQLGGYFDVMRKEGLLDLANRKNKAPHAWCATYALARKPFIFMNATGTQRNVMTLLHEAGHAFHVFEMAAQPYYHQLEAPAEFCEVASMAMELLAAPYLAADKGGFYSEEDASRARAKHLENAIIVSWPYCAAMDVLQHWIYTNPEEASDFESCGRKWADIWLRFMPVVDWEGLEDPLMNGWQNVPHFFGWAFYALEYAIARLGSVQIWRNATEDQKKAVSQYRGALSLGGTVALPGLFEVAGARFAFDGGTLREAVRLMERTIDGLR